MSARAEERPADEQLERAWWLRMPAVLLAPTAVFAALRDDSDDAARARQEPVAAIVGLAGIGGVLLTRTARTVINDPAYSPIVIPVWAFIGGVIYGLVVYWFLGSYRRARHVLALAFVPLALSVVTLWPVRIALYGSDLFRTGGNDYGRGDAIFGGIELGFLAWCALLLVTGVRAVHGWTWWRALGTVAIVAVLPALLALPKLL